MHRIAPFLVIVLLAFAAACAGPPAGRLLVVDPDELLDRVRLDSAAAPLVARGAQVVVVLAAQGDASGADASRQLDAAGMLRNNQAVPDLLAVYVSLSPRYSELRAGERWRAVLDSAALEQIRQEALNPTLRAGDVTGGAAAALEAFEARLVSSDQIGVVTGRIWLGLSGVVVITLLLARAGTRLQRWWRRTPAAGAVGWIWQRSPMGRAQARRESARAIAVLRREVEGLARQAQRALDGPAGRAPALAEAMAALEKRHAVAVPQAAVDAAVLLAWRELAAAYRRLVAEASDVARGFALVDAAAAGARERLAQVQAAFEAATNPRPGRRRRAGGAIRAPSAAGYAQLAELQNQLQQSDQQRAMLGTGPAAVTDLLAALAAQRAADEALRTAAQDLWQAELPEAYAAWQRGRRAGPAFSGLDSYGAVRDESPAGPSSSPGMSDWSGGTGDSGGESRAGGEW